MRGLWLIPLETNTYNNNNNKGTFIVNKKPSDILSKHPPPLPDKINNVYKLKTKSELIRYYHAAAGFQTKPSWIAAITNSHYSSCPGLDATTAAKYLPESEEMWKGHGQKIKSGLRSTKQLIEAEIEEEIPIAIKSKQKVIYTVTYNLKGELDRKMYTDQTGKFPVTSYLKN